MKTNYIKQFRYFLLSIISALALSSCADSFEKVMEDALDMGEEMIELLEAYEQGDISESECIEGLNNLKEDSIELQERMKVLMEEEGEDFFMKPDERNDEMKELMDESMRMGMRMEQLTDKLKKSGKWTPAIQKIMESP